MEEKKLCGIGMRMGLNKKPKCIIEYYSIKKETDKMFYTNETMLVNNCIKTFKKEDIGDVFENLQKYGCSAEPFIVLLNPTRQEIDEAVLKVYDKYKEYWFDRFNKEKNYYEEVLSVGEKLKDQLELKKEMKL